MSELNWGSILDEQDESGEGSYGAIPANTYRVTVKDATPKVASTGSKMLNLTLQVQGGPYDNRLVWTNIVFAVDNPTAMKFTLRKLAALGLTREWLAEVNPGVDLIASKLVGAVADANVEVRQWNGEDRNDVKSFTRVTDAAPTAPKAATVPTPAPAPAAPVAKPAEPPMPPTPAAAPAAGGVPLPESEVPF